MTAPDVNADVRARLLPCPFCGGEGLVTQNQSLRSVWRVSCKNCDAGPYGSIGREAAVKKWNRRAAHADLPEEVRELVRASQAILDGLAVAEPVKRVLFQELRVALAKFTHQEKEHGS